MTTGDHDLDGIGYAQALAELEAILAELEHEAVDVDHLAERVQRAAVRRIHNMRDVQRFIKHSMDIKWRLVK